MFDTSSPMTARQIAMSITVLTCLGLPQAEAQVDLDVGRWLNRPKVKLVVVEFYATWCKPYRELGSTREVNGSDRHMQQLL